jgi:hypothetical protein
MNLDRENKRDLALLQIQFNEAKEELKSDQLTDEERAKFQKTMETARTLMVPLQMIRRRGKPY